MDNIRTMNESFSIHFSGTAFENHAIPACALAQSLRALDGLIERAAKAAYGMDSEVAVTIRAGGRPGTFTVDIEPKCPNESSVDFAFGAESVSAGSVAQTIKSLIRLCKFALGQKVEMDPREWNEEPVSVTNENGLVGRFHGSTVNLYRHPRIRSLLSRLTQTLDQEGAESIRISYDDDDPDCEIVSRKDKAYFRQEDGMVLTDNEAELILNVVGPMMRGSGKGWRFSEGADGIDFVADVGDEAFLEDVKSRKIAFENGTSIRAVVRTVQRKNMRIVTARTIVEVKEVIPASANLF